MWDLSQEDEKAESELEVKVFTTKIKDVFLSLPVNH